MALNGLVGAAWGVELVPLAARFHLAPLVAGTLFTVRGAASLGGAMVAGALSDRLPRQALLTVYAAALTACLLAVAAAPGWWLVLAGAAGISATFGAVGIETSALTALAAGPRRGRQLSITNAVYGIGAAVGPFVAGLLSAGGAGWRLPFALWAMLALAVLLPFRPLARRVAPVLRPGAVPAARGALWRTLGGRLGWIWALAFTYNGVAWSIVGWSATWLVRRFGAGLLLGASSATAFYSLLTVGRLANAWLSDRMSTRSLLVLEALLTAAGLAAAAQAHGALEAVGAFGLTGLAMGGLYPNAQALAVALFPDRPGAMTASVSMAGAAGTMTVPELTGSLGSPAAAMTSLLGWAAVVAGLGVATAWGGRGVRRPKGAAAGGVGQRPEPKGAP
jgi:MFS family permease